MVTSELFFAEEIWRVRVRSSPRCSFGTHTAREMSRNFLSPWEVARARHESPLSRLFLGVLRATAPAFSSKEVRVSGDTWAARPTQASPPPFSLWPHWPLTEAPGSVHTAAAGAEGPGCPHLGCQSRTPPFAAFLLKRHPRRQRGTRPVHAFRGGVRPRGQVTAGWTEGSKQGPADAVPTGAERRPCPGCGGRADTRLPPWARGGPIRVGVQGHPRGCVSAKKITHGVFCTTQK